MPNIWEVMEEEATAGGMFYKPQTGKINRIRVLNDPIRGISTFKDGKERIQYSFVVTGDDPKTPLIWAVSAKGALQQLVAIMKANKLATMVGSILQIAVSGEGMERKYTILPIELPTPTSTAQAATDFPRATLEKAFPKLFAPEIPVAPK